MGNKKTNILIVGAGKGGDALIDVLSRDELVNIIGVVDPRPDAPGIKRAAKLKIPVDSDWRSLIKDPSLDGIIDVTGSVEVYAALEKEKSDQVDVIGGPAAKMMWVFMDELDAQTWGLKKTNDAIKLLYKELEEKNKELRKLDQLKSDFLSTVSHELRTPLTSIREGVSQVLEGILGETTEDQREFLSIALEDIDRLRRIINNLLDVSKIEAKKVELHRTIVDISTLVRGVGLSFIKRIEGLGLELRLHLPEEKVEVYVDKDKIVQVFTNLIGNAVKFTKEGYIDVSVEDKGDKVECYVADSGVGISKEDMSEVFSKFSQFSRTDGAGEKGTGLGLSIVKGIIELHKAKVEVDSELGKGTKFVFVLPKYTLMEVFAESVTNGIEEANEQGTSLSIMFFDVENYYALQEKSGSQKTLKVINLIDDMVKNNLRRKADVAIKDTRAILVMLPATEKEGAEVLAGRISHIVNEALAREYPEEQVKITYKIATFPEDGNASEELLNKIEEQK